VEGVEAGDPLEVGEEGVAVDAACEEEVAGGEGG